MLLTLIKYIWEVCAGDEAPVGVQQDAAGQPQDGLERGLLNHLIISLQGNKFCYNKAFVYSVLLRSSKINMNCITRVNIITFVTQKF